MVFNPTLYNGPIRHHRPNQLMIRASMFLLLPAVAELVLITTLFGVKAKARAPFPDLLTQSLLAIAVAFAFSVVVLAVLLPLAPFSEAISLTVASRLERVAAVVSVTILLLATSLFVFVGLFGKLDWGELAKFVHPNVLALHKRFR